MKNVKSITNVRSDVYRTADTVNHAGGKAWKPSDEFILNQFAMTGTMNNSFYCKQKDVIQEIEDIMKRVDASILAPALIKGRNEGFIRAFPILGLVHLSMKEPKEVFKTTFPQVVKTGNDLIDFIEICKGIRGLGRAVKTAINDWIAANCNEYYSMKYRNQIADAIRLTRFKGEDPIFAYVLSKYSDRMKSYKDARFNEALEKYPVLKAREDFIAALQADKHQEALEIIKAHKIDVDSLTAYYNLFNKDIWMEIARLTPVMRFIKYLNKFDSVGVFNTKEGMDLFRNKVTVESLNKAKVFPFRVYVAYEQVTNSKVKDYLGELLDQYTINYDWDVFNNYSWVISPDISGSMTNKIANSDLTFVQLSGMFTGFFRKGLKDCDVIPWNTQVVNWNVPKTDSVISHMRGMKRINNGGTHMEAGVKHMLEKNLKYDFCVFITDTEEYGRGWLQYWKEYKKKNPAATAFIIREDSYMSSPISDSDARKLDVYQVFGWNDSVINFMKFVISQ